MHHTINHAKTCSIMKTTTYLDYNATAPIRPQVIELMADIMQRPLNPSSVHKQGRAAKSLIEQSRRTIAEHLSCFPAELIFTGSGTEANNMALRSFDNRLVAISATEHASVMNTMPDATLLPVDQFGILDMEALALFLKSSDQPALVSVMLANNETGVIQPIHNIAALVHEYDGLLHCDAVQAFGKIPVDVNLLGVDMLSLSAHKLGAAQGIGALFVSQALEPKKLITGGGQELGRRAGTENVAGIAGFAKAVELAIGDAEWKPRLRGWLDAMEMQCAVCFPDEHVVLGQGAERLPNTSALRMPKRSSETQLMRFDLAGFAISAGSACSSGRIEPSHVVRAMLGGGARDDVVRVSGGWDTTEAEIQAFAEAWCGVVEKAV